MTIRPLHDRVLLKRKEADTQSKGGLFLPEAAQKKSHLAEVVAVGTGRVTDSGETLPLKVELGMTVVLNEWSGDSVKVDGEELLFVRERDILGVEL